MCYAAPVIIAAASLLVSASATAIGVVEKNKAASASKKAADNSAQAANIATIQQEAADTVKEQDVQKSANQAKATAIASANETGTSGNSVDFLIQDYNMQEQQFRDATNTQQGWGRAQLALQKKGFNAGAQGAINEAGAPAFIGAGLRIAQSAADTYSAYNAGSYGKT